MDIDDPSVLSLAELRSLRHDLQRGDDAVSYVRRVTQARLDFVRAEQRRRAAATDDVGESVGDDRHGELRSVLSQHLTGDVARPPRPLDDVVDDHELATELAAVCSEHGFDKVEDLTDGELSRLETELSAFERRVSDDRRSRYDQLDALSAELVRRYRDGEATVDGLLGDRHD